LTELARAADGRVTGGDPEVRGITADSRRVAAGDLFVAIAGAHADGRRFVPQALAAGAVAVCAREPVDGAPTLVVADTRRALALLSVHRVPHRRLRRQEAGVVGGLLGHQGVQGRPCDGPSGR
jgi:UDP-N-acetylmuramyl pentapeptide synthase